MAEPSSDPPSSGLSGSAWNWFAKHSDDRAVKGLRQLVHGATRYVHAENHDIRTNGEAQLLDLVGPGATTILDVGACMGDWALEAARRAPSADIHCFEIASPTRERLRARVRDQARVHVVPAGLAESEGSVQVKYYETRPGWTSVYDYPHEIAAEWIEEPVTTGDAYLERVGNPPVDLVKLDTEGGELAILRGFGRALSEGALRAIQFEYGYAAVYSHGLLRDFYELLEPLGYTIGRLGRDGVGFRPYRLEDENFFGPNMVAVQRSDGRLIESLTARD